MLGLTALVGVSVALWTKAQLRKDTDQWRLLAYTGPLACSFSPSHCVCVCVCVFEALSVANTKCKWVSHFQSVNPSYSQFKSVMLGDELVRCSYLIPKGLSDTVTGNQSVDNPCSKFLYFQNFLLKTQTNHVLVGLQLPHRICGSHH